ncbi:MAG TPA: hypothetical protein VM425_03395 [Myxococcota bacterium]|nr:hypothetical protein [Myxococcota bacterium]
MGRFQSDLVSANGTFEVDLDQSGTALSGGFSSPRLDLEGTSLSGTQQGGSISFSDDVEHIEFKGTVKDDMTAKGTYTFPGLADTGKWWASRVDVGSFAPVDCFDLEYRPNGLAFDGEFFWVVSSSSLRRMSKSGSILSDMERPGNSAGGDPKACFDGEHLWFLNWYELFELDSSGQTVSHFEADPGEFDWLKGLACVEGDLWASADSRKLHQVNTQLSIQKTLDLAVLAPDAIENDGSTLWIVSRYSMLRSRIYGIDWEGWTRKLYDLTEDFEVSDLAYDGETLWMADMQGSRICRLQSVE